jgi:RimJ/RimL family protein N-acetyltransferase
MDAPFTFRPVLHADLGLLHEWLNRPHVAEWWAGPMDFDRVEAEWAADLAAGVVSPMLSCLDDVPVGYVQSYDVMRAGPGWWTEETDPGARGIDQFLANVTDLGRGLGTEMIREFLVFLFADPRVTKVQTDPSPDNLRAIRACEKAGFRRVREVTTPDGPSLLMVIRRRDQ